MSEWRDEALRRHRHRQHLYALEGDHARRQAADKELCRRDFLYFYRNYGWMFDPDAPQGQREVPCIPWDSQVEFIEWMQERRAAGESAFLKKSRKIGISWTVLIYFTWCFLFEKGFKGLIGSRVQQQVDHPGDMNALFPKIRWLLRMLPKHLRPNPETYDDVFMKIQNREMDTVITGESTNLQFGAAGRVNMVFIDEAARINSPLLAQIWEATESVGPRLLVFNAADSVGHFVRQQMDKVPARMCRIMDWRADPRRPKDFKALKCIPVGDLTESQFSQSYDCQDGAGRIGTILSVSEAVNGYRDDSSGFDPEMRRKQDVIVAWDWGSGPRKQVTAFLMLELGPQPIIRIDKVIPWGRVPFFDPTRREDTQLERVKRILEEEYGGPAVFHTGDSAGGQKESTQMSRIDSLRAFGFRWEDQQTIVDPWSKGGDEVFQVNHTPWKLHIVETITQPMLNAGHLLIHTERAADALEAGQEWSWAIPQGLSEFEAQRLNREHHRMEKTAISDIAEPVFLYGPHAVTWYLKALRAGSIDIEEQLLPFMGEGSTSLSVGRWAI